MLVVFGPLLAAFLLMYLLHSFLFRLFKSLDTVEHYKVFRPIVKRIKKLLHPFFAFASVADKKVA